MKVLVTGAKGFVGKNLCLVLKEKGHVAFEYDLGSTEEELRAYIKEADWIVHLAGINRPLDPKEFLDGNVNFTKKLLDVILEMGSKAPIIFSSSTQAERDNPYGVSKKMAEDQLFAFAKEHGHPVYVYRLYNVYGKWCRPNYNSVIATWCHNIARGIEIQINKDAPAIDFVHVDDVVESFLKQMAEEPKGSDSICYPEPHDTVTLSEIASLLYSYKESRINHMAPEMHSHFATKLYSTYLSYLPEDDFTYDLLKHEDARGSFTEFLKTVGDGQVSVNVSHPGITKGNHYHHHKNEKFLVVTGSCEIKFRKVDSEEVICYTVSGKDLRVVDIPPGYTHSIKTIGEEDSVTIMWANELFDPANPDTIFLPVEKE